MLLTHGPSVHGFNPMAHSATQLLHRELEFEYCLIRAGFFQGLLNWLFAIGLRFFVSLATQPDDVRIDMVEGCAGSEDTPRLALKRMCLGAGLMLTMFSLVIMMVAFYNYHLNYYSNYFAMLRQLRHLAWKRYVACVPTRVLPRIAFATIMVAMLMVVLSFALPSKSNRSSSSR